MGELTMETLSQLIIILFGITLPCCILTARYVRKRERAMSDNAINNLLESLQEALPDLVINHKTIPLNKLNKIKPSKVKPSKPLQDPYGDDVDPEETFERIIQNEDCYK